MNKNIRKKVWYAQFGAELVAECPGCLKTQMHLERYSGWEASHICPSARGGNYELYNLVALCSVCNKRMGTENMFSYFFDMQNIYALEQIIMHVKNIVRTQFKTIWTRTNGRISEIAKHYFNGRAGIPDNHAVKKFFIEYDIKIADEEVLVAKRTFEEKLAAAKELRQRYDCDYVVKLPILKKRRVERIQIPSLEDY